MRKLTLIGILLMVLLCLGSALADVYVDSVSAEPTQELTAEEQITQEQTILEQSCDITFFFSPTCPHCAKEKILLNELEIKYPNLNISRHNIGDDFEFYEEYAQQHNSIAVGVPRTFIGDKVFVGFAEEEGPLEYIETYQGYNGYENQIEDAILDCLNINITTDDTNQTNQTSCPGPINKTLKSSLFLPLMILFIFGIFYLIFRKQIKRRYFIGLFVGLIIIILFFLSKNLPSRDILSFAKQFSFPVFTFIIALIDGFNPCAFAVLAILLSMLIYAKSKPKMMLIGSIFILTSGIMYFIFIIVLLVLRTELLGGYKEIIRLIVAIIALVIGLINVKDFFFFKKGISLTIKEGNMNKITKMGRKVVQEIKEANTARGMFIAVLATIIMAVFVNLVELGCTLILPVQYIEILITNFGTNLTLSSYLYIAFYCLVYVIPLFAILVSFLYTFKSERMTENKGKILKLVSGIILVGLGLIMLLKPELLILG